MKVHLYNFLESMCSSKQDHINQYMIEELLILANQPDIFQRDITGEMNHFIFVVDNGYWRTLQKLHLITTFRHEQSGTHYYEICKLTSLGQDFVTNETNIKKWSQKLFKQYHRKLIKQAMLFPTIILSIICGFVGLLLLLIGTNGFTTSRFYLNSKALSLIVSPAVIFIMVFIIISLIILTMIIHDIENPALYRTGSLDNHYNDLCAFISEDFVQDAIKRKARLINLNNTIRFMTNHLDQYMQMMCFTYSLRPFKSLLFNYFLQPKKSS